MAKQVKVIVEKHADGYVAYLFETELPVLEVFVAEAGITI